LYCKKAKQVVQMKKVENAGNIGRIRKQVGEKDE